MILTGEDKRRVLQVLRQQIRRFENGEEVLVALIPAPRFQLEATFEGTTVRMLLPNEPKVKIYYTVTGSDGVREVFIEPGLEQVLKGFVWDGPCGPSVRSGTVA